MSWVCIGFVYGCHGQYNMLRSLVATCQFAFETIVQNSEHAALEEIRVGH